MRSGLVDMTAQECQQRMASAGVGRLVLCAPDGPRIYPVNFALVDGDVVFRVAPYTDLGRLAPGSTVAFEVDDIDHEAHTGWSVVVRGTASTVDDPDEVIRLRRLSPEPWAGGQRRLFIRVHPRTTTGRLVSGA